MTEDLLLNLPPGALSRVPFHPSQEIELAAARLIARADQIRAGIAAYPDGALLGVPVGGGGADEYAPLLAKFEGAGDEVAVHLNQVAGANAYVLSQHLGDRLYSVFEIGHGAVTEGEEMLRLQNLYIHRLYAGFNKTTTPATSTSGAWSEVAGNYPGGVLSYSSTAGSYVEITTGSGVTHAGALANHNATNVGVAVVSIDGDKTRATLLPTAQDLVTAGTLSDTVLVANGGTLNPTDRVWNQYSQAANYTGGSTRPSAPYSHYELFADDLTAGSHTIRITVTGYKQAAASAAAVVFYLFLAHGPSVHTIADSNYFDALLPVQDIHAVGSAPVYEISYNAQPTGASNREWVGHTGSLKFTAGGAPVVTVDSVEESLAVNGYNVAGNDDITLTMQFGVRHSEIDGGATNIGTLDITYTLNATTGLWISHTLTWGMAGTANGYPCMMTLESAVFDRCKALDTDVFTLTKNDASATNATTQMKAIFAWDYDGYQGALMYIPDLAKTVESWSKSTNFLYFLDAAGTWDKAYAERFPSAEPFENGTVWESECNYRFQWFADGANAALAT